MMDALTQQVFYLIKNKLFKYFSILTVFSALPMQGFAETDQQLMAAGQWRDPVTKLIWMRCSIGQSWSGSTCTGDPLIFHDSKDAENAIKKLNAAGGFAGKTNWRLPQIKELVTIRKCSQGWRKIGDINLPERERRNFGQDHELEMTKIPKGGKVPKNCTVHSTAPTLDTHIFPNTPSNGEYWSNSFSWQPIGYQYKAWHIAFGSGFVARTINYTDYQGLARAVRER